MGNQISRLYLRIRHPVTRVHHPEECEDCKNYLISLNTPIVNSNAIILIVIDTETGNKVAVDVYPGLRFGALLFLFAHYVHIPMDKLEMRVNGYVMDPEATAQTLGLKDGDTVKIARREPFRTEAATDDDPADGDDEHARIKAIVRERMDRKSKIVRETFGYEYRGEEPYPGAARGIPDPRFWSRIHRQRADGSGRAQIEGAGEGKEAEDPDAITPAPPRSGEERGPMGSGGAVVPVGRLAVQGVDAAGTTEARDADTITPAPLTSTGVSGPAASDGTAERAGTPEVQQGGAGEGEEADKVVEAGDTEAIMPEPMTSAWQAPPEWGVR